MRVWRDLDSVYAVSRVCRADQARCEQDGCCAAVLGPLRCFQALLGEQAQCYCLCLCRPPAHQNGGAQGSCTQTAAMCMTSVRCCMPACSSPGQVAVYSKQHSARLPLTCACGMNHPRAAFQSIQRHSVGFCCSHSRDSTLLAHAGAVYNVVDDNPASRLEVMAHARQLLTGQLSPQSLASPQSGSDR